MVLNYLKVLWLYFALEICARSEVSRAMTRDDISQVLIGSGLETFVFGCCCGTALLVSMGELCVCTEQSWLQFVVALGIAFCFGLVHGKLCIGC